MGDKDFIKPLLERRGTVFFGKVGRCFALHFLQLHCTQTTGMPRALQPPPLAL